LNQSTSGVAELVANALDHDQLNSDESAFAETSPFTGFGAFRGKK